MQNKMPKPKAMPKAKVVKPAKSADDLAFEKMAAENRKRMQAASAPGRKNYQVQQTTGSPDEAAAKRAGYKK
jgi:hypothetical protein